MLDDFFFFPWAVLIPAGLLMAAEQPEYHTMMRHASKLSAEAAGGSWQQLHLKVISRVAFLRKCNHCWQCANIIVEASIKIISVASNLQLL